LRNASTQHIPVIIISGNEPAIEQFYANRIGADDFMKKPFSRDEVFARIEMLAQRESGIPVQERIAYTGQHRQL
jgi:DNA-binding response OmpR family regulator